MAVPVSETVERCRYTLLDELPGSSAESELPGKMEENAKRRREEDENLLEELLKESETGRLQLKKLKTGDSNLETGKEFAVKNKLGQFPKEGELNSSSSGIRSSSSSINYSAAKKMGNLSSGVDSANTLHHDDSTGENNFNFNIKESSSKNSTTTNSLEIKKNTAVLLEIENNQKILVERVVAYVGDYRTKLDKWYSIEDESEVLKLLGNLKDILLRIPKVGIEKKEEILEFVIRETKIGKFLTEIAKLEPSTTNDDLKREKNLDETCFQIVQDDGLKKTSIIEFQDDGKRNHDDDEKKSPLPLKTISGQKSRSKISGLEEKTYLKKRYERAAKDAENLIAIVRRRIESSKVQKLRIARLENSKKKEFCLKKN